MAKTTKSSARRWTKPQEVRELRGTYASNTRTHKHSGKRLGFDMMNVARAIRTYSAYDKNYFGSQLQIDTDRAIHRFNNTRIGIRLLNDMYARASDPKRNTAFTAVGRGILHKRLAVNEEIERAAAFVESIAVENLYMCPEIVVRNHFDNHVSYIPAHVWYIAVEILKNAVVAVVNKYQAPALEESSSSSSTRVIPSTRPRLPPIYVDIITNEFSTEIHTMDSGGGIDSIEHAMAYCFTTGKRPAGNDLHGAGIGLPMVKAYSEYFGGSLGIQNKSDGSRVSVRLLHDMDSFESVCD